MKEEKVKEKEVPKAVPEGQDLQVFRATVLRAIEAEPDGSPKTGALKRKLKAVDAEIERLPEEDPVPDGVLNREEWEKLEEKAFSSPYESKGKKKTSEKKT